MKRKVFYAGTCPYRFSRHDRQHGIYLGSRSVLPNTVEGINGDSRILHKSVKLAISVPSSFLFRATVAEANVQLSLPRSFPAESAYLVGHGSIIVWCVLMVKKSYLI